MKRLFDLVAALLGLALLSPLLGGIGLLIKVGDRGPVFYRGLRVGRFGKPFRIFKFRTMVVDAEKRGGPSTPGDDPRITPLGRWLRKYKLDELPQLLNVLAGDMSLVGPRPEVRHYTDMFTAEEQAILSVRPGITDWASLWNPDEGTVLAGTADPEKAYLELIRPTKIQLQLRYVRERSFFSDLKIILQTLAAMAGVRNLLATGPLPASRGALKGEGDETLPAMPRH